MNGRDGIVCPGCENPIDGQGQKAIMYYGELWHKICADEDRRVMRCMDYQDMRYEGLVD